MSPWTDPALLFSLKMGLCVFGLMTAWLARVAERTHHGTGARVLLVMALLGVGAGALTNYAGGAGGTFLAFGLTFAAMTLISVWDFRASHEATA